MLFLCYCCIAMETVLSAVMTFPSDLSIDSIKCQFGLCQDADLFVMVSGIRPVKDPLYLVHAFSGKLLKLLAGLVSGSILCVSLAFPSRKMAILFVVERSGDLSKSNRITQRDIKWHW